MDFSSSDDFCGIVDLLDLLPKLKFRFQKQRNFFVKSEHVFPSVHCSKGPLKAHDFLSNLVTNAHRTPGGGAGGDFNGKVFWSVTS
jgi:hypothetical protein